MEDLHSFDVARVLDTPDHRAGQRLFGIPLRRVHDRDRGPYVPLQRRGCERALRGRQQHRRQIATQAPHQRLTFGIAETHVELDQFRPRGSDHETGEQHANEGTTLGLHATQRRQNDLLHGLVAHRVGEDWRGRISAHAAGVWALVAIISALVILRRRQGQGGLAVANGKEARFLAGQEILDDNALPGGAELAQKQYLVDGRVRLASGFGDHDALAARQTVRLDHEGRFAVAQIRLRADRFIEDLVVGGRDIVARAEILGERF